MKHAETKPLPRRRFLQQMVLLGGATGAGALVFSNAGAMSPASTGSPGVGAKTTGNKGYRLTEHIRTYYEKAQI
ncbi:MAG: formate dehydrogenase [Pseudomonadota bacterium]|nr:formate dehydrogenase [Pseudomonadota bacterium]